MNKTAKLILCLKVYGFVMQKIECKFLEDDLSTIDKITFPFLDADDFLNKNKEVISKQIKEKTIGVPSFIELDEEEKNPIFIKIEGRKIQVLFQNVIYKKKKENIEHLIKSRLINGKLSLLWNMDRKLKEDYNYESIFKDCNGRILAKIEANLVNEEELDYIWNFLKMKNRFYSLLRFILLEGEEIYLAQYFLENIPFKEYEEIREYTRTKKVENIRLPYKDN